MMKILHYIHVRGEMVKACGPIAHKYQEKGTCFRLGSFTMKCGKGC